MSELSSASAVIVATDRHQSQNTSDYDTLWAPVAGQPLLVWSVQALEATEEVAEIVLVVREERAAEAEALRVRHSWRKARAVPASGPRRCDAVRAGLDALPATGEWVLLHDAARPFVTAQLAATVLAAARTTGAAAAYEPVKETIKRVRDGVVVETPDRASLALLQTPQAFRRALLMETLAAWCPPRGDPPDVATALLAWGVQIALVLGGHENLRVATPDALEIAEALLGRQTPER